MDAVLYDETQRGKLAWLAVVFVVIEILFLVTAGDDLEPLAITITIVAVTLIVVTILIASTLRVILTTEAVELRFGWGWPKKRIERSRIAGHHPVRNSWLLGWGIRWFPGGTMWNVWGLDAVELELDSGRKFRIGTADPDGLSQALQR